MSHDHVTPTKKRKHGYNCSYVKVDSPRSFDEILYVLMNGTGVGFSVEEEYTPQNQWSQMNYMRLILQ